jgi:hypothetical protein
MSHSDIVSDVFHLFHVYVLTFASVCYFAKEKKTWSHATRRSLATNRTCTFFTGDSRFLSTSQVILSIGALPYPMELPPTQSTLID